MDIHTFRNAISNMQREDVLHLRKQLFTEKPESKSARRSRICPKHVWPDVGVTLTAEYFGTVYTAIIVPASKKLKSGRQVKLTSGPAAGTICDSLSDAMLKATEHQRQANHLRRKGVSNGWDFWQWDCLSQAGDPSRDDQANGVS